MKTIVKIAELRKNFGHEQALIGIQFEIKSGEIFGLLGVNGAGKTTTFRMIMGLLEPTNGEITLDDKKIDYDVTDNIGFLTEERSLLTKLTVKEQCIYYGTLKGMSEKDIIETTKQFTGEILQIPPIHSAIKQKGKPVYLLARKGKEVILEPRKITIRKFEITNIEMPAISFRVVCTTGTYIRSLANDFGNALGCGGYLSKLRRTRIGNFYVENATGIDEFAGTYYEK